MHINDTTIREYIEAGKHDLVIKACEPIIYHYMHKTGFWRTFKSDRDDMLQEGRIAILKCMETYDGRTQFTTYVHSAIRNALYSYVRKSKLYEATSVVELDFDVYDQQADMETISMYNTIFGEISAHKHRGILKMYFISGLTQQEIAERVQTSQQWVAWVCNAFKKEMQEKYGLKYKG